MITQSLAAFATAYSDLGPPDRDTVRGFADVIEELVEELHAINEAYVDETNADYAKIMALEKQAVRS